MIIRLKYLLIKSLKTFYTTSQFFNICKQKISVYFTVKFFILRWRPRQRNSKLYYKAINYI